jgi:hypothetical protein
MRPRITPLALLVIGFGASPTEAQIVRGQVVDSVTYGPVAGAIVSLLDSLGVETLRMVADDEGLFLVRAPDGGQFRLRVEADGYRRSMFPPFTLGSSDVKGFMLLIAATAPAPPAPTIEDYVTEFCAEGTVRQDQGVVMGFVRHAETGTPVAGAAVRASWPPVRGRLAELVSSADLGPASGETTTDGDGVYVACGVPLGIPLVFHAASNDLLSDFVELRFDSGGVFIGREHHATQQAAVRWDFHLRSAAQRTAAVTGAVEDATTMEALGGAVVELLGTELQATTARDGGFTLMGLPAGPSKLAVRHAGFRPITLEVRLTQGDTVTLAGGAVRLDALATELRPVVVEAEQPDTRRPLAEFWERREAGGGAFVTREEFMKVGNPQKPSDVLRRMRGIHVRANANYGKPLSNVDPKVSGVDLRRWVIETGRGQTRSFLQVVRECPPLIYLDHMYLGNAVAVNIDDILPLIDVEAVEAYSSAATVPPQLNRTGSTCGVIVFWTR